MLVFIFVDDDMDTRVSLAGGHQVSVVGGGLLFLGTQPVPRVVIR